MKNSIQSFANSKKIFFGFSIMTCSPLIYTLVLSYFPLYRPHNHHFSKKATIYTPKKLFEIKMLYQYIRIIKTYSCLKSFWTNHFTVQNYISTSHYLLFYIIQKVYATPIIIDVRMYINSWVMILSFNFYFVLSFTS